MVGFMYQLPLPPEVIDIICEYKWGDPKKNKKKLMNSVINEPSLYDQVYCRLSSQYKMKKFRNGKMFYCDCRHESLHQKIINILVIPKIYTHSHLFCFSNDLKILYKKKYNNYMDELKNNIGSRTWHSLFSDMTKKEMKFICRCLTKLVMSGKYEMKRETKYSF